MNPFKNTLAALIATAAFLTASSFAQAQPASSATAPASASASAGTELAEGEIRKIDKDNQKLTIKHGPLKNLDMPSMTMVFQVQEPAMLEKVQVGDKVQFIADKVDGKFTVMRLEASR
ncbi:hypothetical protein DBA29_25150 [Xenophilus aerolatus]|jgi:Cu/Ag efflux protein CusF|nr:hypothetical protein [Xenophilus aerolatus]